MKYVKLIAKLDTWFKEGTEVYYYYSRQNNPYQVTPEEFYEEYLP